MENPIPFQLFDRSTVVSTVNVMSSLSSLYVHLAWVLQLLSKLQVDGKLPSQGPPLWVSGWSTNEICITLMLLQNKIFAAKHIYCSSGSGGVPRGPCPPSPVQTSHKKDGRQRWPHRFHVSWPPLPGRWIRCWNEILFFCGDCFFGSAWIADKA